MLEYLESVQGKKILTGISGSQDAQPQAVLHMTGREPAIAGGDVAGFHRKWDKLYRQVMQGTVDCSIRWWREKGGVVALQYHWMKPGDPEGSARVDRPRGSGRLDLAKAITPGTDEHRATGSITIGGVDKDAEVVAAFLYWQVVSKDSLGPDSGAVGATFNTYPLSSAAGPFSKVLDRAGTAPCWSSGGGTGGGGGTIRTYTYRADVRRFLNADSTGRILGNGTYVVQVPDSGPTGNGVPVALGASLVVIIS